jgi:hypothetical protein
LAIARSHAELNVDNLSLDRTAGLAASSKCAPRRIGALAKTSQNVKFWRGAAS